MQRVVVEVEELDEQRMRQEKPLDRRLAWQVGRPLELPDPAGPAERAARSQDRK